MTWPKFCEIIGAFAAMAAMFSAGFSGVIIWRQVRIGRGAKLKHVLPLAISWCLLCTVFAFKYITGRYLLVNGFDQFTLCVCFVAYTSGTWGLFWLWTHPKLE